MAHPPHVTPALAALLAVAAALAGCGQPAADGPADPASQGVGLHGVVVDAAIRPVVGAALSIDGRNETAVTGDDGAYAFPDTLPRDVPLLLLVRAAGFETASRQVTVPTEGEAQYDIELALLPPTTGYVDVLHVTGLIGCQVAVAAGEEEPQRSDCGGEALPSKAAFDFPLGAGLVSAVIEVVWEQTQPMAASLGADLKRSDDPQGEPLSQGVGRSPLRLVLARDVVAQHFATGGDVRLSVYALPITDEDEQAVAVALHANQAFDAYASLFYGVGPDPSYSFVDDA